MSKKIEILRDGGILNNIMQNLNYDGDLTEAEAHAEIEKMDEYELLDRYLTWEGILGYSSRLRNAVKVTEEAAKCTE